MTVLAVLLRMFHCSLHKEYGKCKGHFSSCSRVAISSQCLCVQTWICTYPVYYFYSLLHTLVCTHPHRHTHKYTYTQTHTHVHTNEACTHMLARMHTHIRTHHIHACTCTHTPMYTHTTQDHNRLLLYIIIHKWPPMQ